jgi:hypothetical protein
MQPSIVSLVAEHATGDRTELRQQLRIPCLRMGEDGALQQSYAPKLLKVLPPKKALRYLQIENKIRAAVKYELAGSIPVVQ